jgi:hypothetical protein
METNNLSPNRETQLAEEGGLPAIRPNMVNSSIDPELGMASESTDHGMRLGSPHRATVFRVDARAENEAQGTRSGVTLVGTGSFQGNIGDTSAVMGLLNDSNIHEAITASTVNPDLNASERAQKCQFVLF